MNWTGNKLSGHYQYRERDSLHAPTTTRTLFTVSHAAVDGGSRSYPYILKDLSLQIRHCQRLLTPLCGSFHTQPGIRLRRRPHEYSHFWNHIFFTRNRVDKDLNYSEGPFQKRCGLGEWGNRFRVDARSICVNWKKYPVPIINGIHVDCAEGVVYMEKKSPCQLKK